MIKYILYLLFNFSPLIAFANCDEWFEKLNINTSGSDCYEKCNSSAAAIETYYCKDGCVNFCNINKKKKEVLSKECDEWFKQLNIHSKENECVDECISKSSAIDALKYGFCRCNVRCYVDCDEGFRQNIKSKDIQCFTDCSLWQSTYGQYYDNCKTCQQYCSPSKEGADIIQNSCADSGCCSLKSYAADARFKNNNKCKAFSKILDEAIQGANGQKDRVRYVMENLKNVLIGKGLTRGNRATGPCYAGTFKGSEGLKGEYKDDSDQIQHAFAGVYIGYKYGLFVCKLIEVFQEDSEVDKKLYRATCPIGYSLLSSDKPDLYVFKDSLLKTIGDASCSGE